MQNVNIASKSLIFKTTLFILLALTVKSGFACKYSIENAEISNPEFYINFTSYVEKIFGEHGFTKSENTNDAGYVFSSKNYITTGSNYFRLKQVNIEFKVVSNSSTINVKSLNNCFTVSCPASEYASAIKVALKKLNQRLPNCSK